jgi:cyclase
MKSLMRLAAVGALLIVPQAATAQNFDNVTIRTERLADSVFVLYGAGGNIGLMVGPEAVFVIDDQYAPLTPKIQAAISALTDKPVRFVLNTHWHYDHTGGNENMGKAGALLVAHDNRRHPSA